MNRATLANTFAETARRASWKTYVIEAHPTNDVKEFLTDAFGYTEPTEDIHMHRLVGEVDLFVDHLDPRFWNLHTTEPTGLVEPYLRRVISSRRDLDRMWLPSDHLRNIWHNASPRWVATNFSSRRLTPSTDDVADLKLRVGGPAANGVLDLIEKRFQTAVPHSQVGISVDDPHHGSINEVISHNGRFMANGNDFGFHQTIVRQVVGRYRRLVEDVERCALRWENLPDGGSRLFGAPITLQFSRPIPDLDLFLDRLFSSREPFRLWGLPQRVDENMAEVEAVDLHVGHRLRFDVATDWMRVYLFEGGCGNTVARLASNLQHHFDGALSIANEDIDARLKSKACA